MKYDVGIESLVKLMFHSVKYGSYTVNGLLLGTISGEQVQVVDTIPMYHTHTTLSGQTELALELASAHCQQMKAKGKDLKIVGYYEAHAHYSHIELSQFGKVIADKLTSQVKAPLALVVNTPKLADLMASKTKAPPLDVYSQSGTSWKLQGSDANVTWPAMDLAAIIRESMDVGTHLQIADMDEHMDDVSRDFLNPQILKRVVGLPS